MAGTAGEESRESAEIFGEKMEDAFGNVGQAAGALRGRQMPSDDPPEDDDGTNITININS